MVVITYLAQDENSPQPLPFDHVRLCVTGFLEPPVSNSVVFRRFIWLSAVLALWLLIFWGKSFIRVWGPCQNPTGVSDQSRTPPRRRGIRGGAPARRKRLAWVSWNLSQERQWDEKPVAHAGGQQRPLFSPALGSRSQVTTKLIRLSILRILWLTLQGLCLSQLQKSLDWSQDPRVLQSHLHPHPSHRLRRVLLQRHLRWQFLGQNPLLRAVPKGEAASSSKGSATPKFSAASSSKGSVLLNQLRSQSLKGRYDRNLRKRVLHLKALRSRSRWRGAHLRRDLHIPGALIRHIFRVWSAGSLTITTTWWSSSFLRFR